MKKTTWIERLIEEYSVGKRKLEQYRETLDKYEDEIEYDAVTGMISDMKFALEWMKRGRRPGNRRGIEKQNVYQRTALLDTSLFPSLDLEVQERTLTDEEKRAIIDILWELSYRERQCYLLHMAQGWSLQEIADELGIAKSTVQQYVDRAKAKIRLKLEKVS